LHRNAFAFASGFEKSLIRPYEGENQIEFQFGIFLTPPYTEKNKTQGFTHAPTGGAPTRRARARTAADAAHLRDVGAYSVSLSARCRGIV